jgi:hypothetical protein
MIGNPQHLKRQGIGPEKATEHTSGRTGVVRPLRPVLHSGVGSAMELVQQGPGRGRRPASLGQLPSSSVLPGKGLLQYVIP